jgi:hypothetical protein
MRTHPSVFRLLLVTVALIILQSIFSGSLNAQYLLNSDSAYKAGTTNSGRIWGYAFGDAYYKAHSDSFNRGGSNQYSGIPQGRNAFQFRRIYLGYDFNISKKFSSELLLAAEDNFPAYNAAPSSTAASGDELSNSKLSFYIKLANIRWKQIWKGTDFVFGQMATPTFALMSEKIWNYRSVEKTITDIRKSPSYDFGGALQGVFDPATKNFGYNILVANGSSAKPASTSYKWFYGELYAYLFDKKLVLDAYADYERLNWSPTWHHSRQMLKGFIAYNSAATASKGMDPGTGFTVGTEFFVNNLKNDLLATKKAGGVDTLTNAANGVSVFVHGDIVKSKLRFFVRYDAFNPMTKTNNTIYNKYVGNTSNYNDNSYTMTYSNTGAPASATATGDESYKQQFISAGLDFTPVKNVHLMPNLWYNSYASQLANTVGKVTKDHDTVYRLTFYFVFGK